MSQSDLPQEVVEARELRVYLRTVGDTVRLQVLRRLAQNGEMSVTELARELRISQPLVSWHLGVLRRIELVSIRREGRLAWYSLNRPQLRAFRERFTAWVAAIDGATDKESATDA
jgi:DNA-binding transcriptional ArsR family regulator